MEKTFGELVETLLQGLLQVLILEDGQGHGVVEAQVRVDPEGAFPQGNLDPEGDVVTYISQETVRFSEPRIPFMTALLEHLLPYCQFFTPGGDTVQIRGFRLIPRAWVVPYRESLTDNLGSLSSSCTCHCRFCYMDGNPYFNGRGFNLDPGEARLRIKYYNREEKQGLFPILREYLEPFANPQVLDIFRLLRQHDKEEYLTLITNGNRLTQEVVEELAKLKPINVNISLNTLNPQRRRYLMRDQKPEVVLQSFHLLSQAGIPFGGSIVASPQIPLEELEETILFLHEEGACGIRVVLPGYTRFHPPGAQVDTHHFWPQVVETIKGIRPRLTNFLFLQPNAYWLKDNKPLIDGIIPNSPAAQTGIRTGDRILHINGISVKNKGQAHKILAAYSIQGMKSVLELERGGRVWSAFLDNNLPLEADYYPFKPVGYPCDLEKMYGICLVETFRQEYLIYLAGILRKNGSRKALVFSSPLMMPQLKEALSCIDTHHYFGGCQVEFETIQPTFWGGNILLGDLTMVSDYIGEIQGRLDRGETFDLVVIPSSFLLDWGRDYQGQVYLEIERQTGVKVQLLPCKTINL